MIPILLNVLRKLFRKDKEGNPVYVKAEIRHVIPILVFEAGLPLHDLPAELQTLVTGVAMAAGIVPKMTLEQIRAAFKAYYGKYPPNPALLREMAEMLSGDESAFERTGVLADILGTRGLTGVLGGGERPKGTVAGGIAARLNAGLALPPKKTR
jgi:hypothetical protein